MKSWRWQDVRAEVNVKERYFSQLARQRGVADGPDGGHKMLGEKAARKLSTICRKCSKDFDALVRHVEAAARTR